MFSEDKHLREPGLAPPAWREAAQFGVDLVEGVTGQRITGNLATLPFRGGAELIAFLGRKTGISPWIIGGIAAAGATYVLTSPQRRQAVGRYVMPVAEALVKEMEGGNRPNSKRPRTPLAFAPRADGSRETQRAAPGRVPGAAVRPCAPVRRQRGPDTSPTRTPHRQLRTKAHIPAVYLPSEHAGKSQVSAQMYLACTCACTSLRLRLPAVPGRIPEVAASLQPRVPTRPNRFSGSA